MRVRVLAHSLQTRNLTKSEIISKVVKEGQFMKICRRITGSDPLTEDLFQEVILILLEKDEQYIVDTFNKGELKFLFARIVMNNFKSNSSPFATKYRKIFANALSFDECFSDKADHLDFNGIKTPSLKGKGKLINEFLSDHTFEVERCHLRYDKIREDLAKPAKNQTEWFEKETVKLVIKHKFISQVSKKTGINKYFLTKAVNNYTQRIKNDKKFNARAV